MTGHVTLTRAGRTAILRLDRPEKRNAMTLEMWKQIPEVVARAESDPEVRVLLVTGGEHFSAGADIAEFATVRSTVEGGRHYDAAVETAENSLAALTKPTIAVISGFCVGGGCELALACDLRICSSDARFAVTPAKVGLVYSMTGTRRLVEAVGAAWAKQLLFLGDQISADTALRIGLVNDVLPPDALESQVAELADRLAGRAQFSVASSKQIVGRILAGEPEDDAVRALYDQGYASRDYAEGIAAFVERRPPQFD